MKIKLIIISIVFLFANCENASIEPMGTIEGKVTIGPLCGIIPSGITTTRDNPCGLSDEALNAIYKTYKVALKSVATSTTASKDFVLDKTGVFKFEVPEGNYEVEVQKVDGSTVGIRPVAGQYTKSAKVIKNQVITLNFDVDTGIR
jgi:hypothetical protein